VQLSYAYHPLTDGQSEVVNHCLETYFRCMTTDAPQKGSNWLSLAEWWYNTTYHTSIHATPYEIVYGLVDIHATPYEIVYGQPPPAYLPYLPGDSKMELVDRSLLKREEMLKLLKFHLRRAQDRMKQLADKHRSDRQFQTGDFVYVKLHPYRQVSVSHRVNAKLAPKFYGPFNVLDRIGAVAYRLDLPAGSRMHNVFHVSQLRKHVGTVVTTTNIPASTHASFASREPESILDRMTVKLGNRAITKVLVKWKHQLSKDATWEFYYDLLQRYPSFNP